jgi:hypothetical protein
MDRSFAGSSWRKSVALLGILAMLPLAVVVARADKGAWGAVAGSFYYANAERTFSLSVKSGGLLAGPIISKRPVASQTDVFRGEALGAPAEDCSNAAYRCIKSGFQAFAVPRNDLPSTARYSIAGTAFRVVKCLRADRTVCQVAVIEADCQTRNLKKHICELYSGGPNKNPDRGPVTYFIYNEDFGVTSIGIAGEKKRDAEATLAAKVYVLQGNIGLLR